MVKRAAAETNKKLGLVDAHRADAISQAAQEVIDGKWDEEFLVDVFQAGAGVSFHMNTNEVIANRANRNSRRRAWRVRARPSQRPRELRSVHQRCFPHRHAPRRLCWSSKTCTPCSIRSPAPSRKRPKSSTTSSSPAARTCRMQSPFVSARNLPPTPSPFAKRAPTLRSSPNSCANSASAAPPSAPASTPIRDYRAEGHRATSPSSPAKNSLRQRHALGDAIERLHGRCQRRAAHARAGNHSHLERSAPARLRPQHRPGGN